MYRLLFVQVKIDVHGNLKAITVNVHYASAAVYVDAHCTYTIQTDTHTHILNWNTSN